VTKKDLWTPREKAIRWFFGRGFLATVGMSFTVQFLGIKSLWAMLLITCLYFTLVHYYFEIGRINKWWDD
tara:strand:- start:66 stop:275 length:210 start_codon:yes stop_codon:yes gene_type:complete